MSLRGVFIAAVLSLRAKAKQSSDFVIARRFIVVAIQLYCHPELVSGSTLFLHIIYRFRNKFGMTNIKIDPGLNSW
ncbi:MAG: hypothetical protein LBM09_01155 [Candidatus Nomurabacteria bacterium]|nr:hypothetical protein [Candidatus Nomurabacteria bacterium]